VWKYAPTLVVADHSDGATVWRLVRCDRSRRLMEHFQYVLKRGGRLEPLHRERGTQLERTLATYAWLCGGWCG